MKQRERTLALLEEDRNLRIRLLIASIDWTRAEFRTRFPIEHDVIQADYERAADLGRPVSYWNQPRSFSRA